MMRILQVMAGAEHGGAETAFADMCVALSRSGAAQIEVVTRAARERNAGLEAAGIKLHTLPFGGRIDLYTPWRLARIVREFRPDIVQTWMSRAAMHVRRWSPASGAPRYVTVSRLGGYYSLKYYRETDFFTTITPDIRDYLIREGVHPDRVRHINNFAETEDADIAPVSRAALATPEGAKVVLFLGRLHEAKAVDILLKAFAEVPDAFLWVAGEGPERAALEALSASLGLSGRVRFLGWRSDRGALLRACDLLVFPSRYEPFGTVFVQGWVYRKPLVTAAADGPRQYVRDGEDGLMVPVEDAPALAAAMRRVLGDPELAARLAQGGHARYLEEFTRERAVAAYLGLYQKIRQKDKDRPRLTT